MNLICIGLNHKVCPVEIREKIAFSEAQVASALTRMRELDGLREWFILSTCNRVELYARSTAESEESLIFFLADFHGVSADELKSYLYRLRGEEVAQHLFRVASGLDSLVVGENEIYGQLRQAFRLANELGTLDSILYQLVERSLRAGKRVRSETKINEGAVSVSSIATELAAKIFGELSNNRVLILGTGKMSELTMKHLIKAGARDITVASRTYERAWELARKFGAQPIRFDEWLRALRQSDIVISSTSAPQPIVTYEDVVSAMNERRHKPLFFIDIAVPRDVDPRVARIDDVYLYDIDDLKTVSEANLRLRKQEVSKCEAIIEHELESFHQWFEFLEAGPVIRKLIAYVDRVVEAELEGSQKAFKGKEQDLNELLRKIKSSLLHAPIEKLKESAKSGSMERYLETLHTLFPLEEGNPRVAGEPVKIRDEISH